MAQSTTPYKKSISGSLGAGMKSLLGGNDRRYYVLEHKVSSKYHKAGENQRIIVDQIELGRASTCQVRFDDSFITVSRRHAAIVKDGDNWKLVHLGTNPTYLNGHEVKKEWYLQNGDEIQLATNGPRLGFIVPAGDKGLVKSIGLSARLSLFRKQALRPYKQAIACLAGLFVLSGCLFTYKIIDQDSQIRKYRADQIQISNEYEEKLRVANEKIAQQKQEWEEEKIRQQEKFKEKIDSLDKATQQAIVAAERRVREQGGTDVGIDAMLRAQNISKDVYFVMTTKVVYILNGREHQLLDEEGHPYGWTATGFLLNDGRFVTARHCVEGWLYSSSPIGEDLVSAVVRASATNSNIKIKSYLTAISTMSNTKFDFTSDDFTINRRLDVKQQIGTDENGQAIYWLFSYPCINGLSELMWSTDWAYTNKTNGHRGDLIADGSLSKSLIPMQKLVASGFPKGIGVMDSSQDVDPIFSELTTSRQGLANNGCILHSRGTDHGNSGGPIFAIKDGKLVVVGIVSRGDLRTGEHNWAVPICNIQ